MVLGRLLLEICDMIESGCNGELMDNAFILCREECHVHGGQLQLYHILHCSWRLGL